MRWVDTGAVHRAPADSGDRDGRRIPWHAPTVGQPIRLCVTPWGGPVRAGVSAAVGRPGAGGA